MPSGSLASVAAKHRDFACEYASCRTQRIDPYTAPPTRHLASRQARVTAADGEATARIQRVCNRQAKIALGVRVVAFAAAAVGVCVPVILA